MKDYSSPGGKLISFDKDANPHSQNLSVLSSLKRGLIIISSISICFIAARNSITWHFQRFWGTSGDFWQARWDKLLDIIGEDPFNLWVYGTFILTFSLYWIIGGVYTIMDVTNKPAFLRRYKIQPGMNEPVDTQQLLIAIRRILFNQIVIGLPLGFLSYRTMESRGFPDIRELPTFHWVVLELAVFLLLEEACFYYSHRLLHSKYLYKYIHKRHHEWTAPIAIIAVYCHPLEHILSNVVPAFLGIAVMGSHIATAWLWLSIVIFSTLTDHSGYHLPFLQSPEFHDFHHLKFNQCFGVLGVLDRIHGTDTNFRQNQAYSRHRMLFNLASAREIFPDRNHSKHNNGKQ